MSTTPNRAKRRAISTPGSGREIERRTPGGIMASIVIHAVILVVIVRLVQSVPGVWLTLARDPAAQTEQRIRFLANTAPPSARRTVGRAGGDNQPLRRTLVPPLVAPAVVPSGIAEPPKSAPLGPVGGSGLVVGGGGPLQGIKPAFTDARLWIPPASPAPPFPLTRTQKLDSAIVSMVTTMEDSLARLPQERAPGDWTFTRKGKKYGIDGEMIRLGKFSLPTALLALLPLNAQANPSGVERDRRNTIMRGEIQVQAARMARDDDFHRAVKALRERKEKERADQKKASEPVIVPVNKPEAR